MVVFRIAAARYIRDLSGEGARLYGGRWNKKGTAALYTAGNRALSAVEYLVHMDFPRVPKDTSIASLELPDNCVIDSAELDSLPPDWTVYPGPIELQDIGTAWLKSLSALALRVPSAVIRGDFNYVLNPVHPDMQNVKVLEVENFLYDPRLLK
jgi:RES domain-containing protein